MFAGEHGLDNSVYYLHKPYEWWSVSPTNSSLDETAYVYTLSSAGMINNGNNTNSTNHVFPVFNLKSDIQYSSGNGSRTDPYVVNVE